METKFEKKNQSNQQEIDNYIRQLNYDPIKLLAYPGDTVTNFVPAKGYFDGNTYIVEKNELHTIDATGFNPAISSANVDITYPGALILANQSLVKNNPQPLLAERDQITISTNLPGATVRSSVLVQRPTYANVSNAISQIVNTWLRNNPDSSSVTTQQLKLDQIIDEKQMEIQFGVSGSYLKNKLGIDFNAARNQSKSCFLAKYEEIFYTVSAQLPSRPSAVFSPELKSKDLAAAGANNENPPAIIQNVQYGQVIFIKFESEEASDTLGAALNAVIKPDGLELSTDDKAKYGDTLKNVSYSVVTLGGNMDVLNGGSFINDLDKLNSVIHSTKFCASTPGYPLYYRAAFLKDGVAAVVNGATEFITTKSTRSSSGSLYLSHHGAFVARFYLYWDELSIGSEGQEKYTTRSWSENGNKKTAPYDTTIPFAANCLNIRMKAEYATGLIWDPWRICVDTPRMPLAPKRTIKITGNTLKYHVAIEPPLAL